MQSYPPTPSQTPPCIASKRGSRVILTAVTVGISRHRGVNNMNNTGTCPGAGVEIVSSMCHIGTCQGNREVTAVKMLQIVTCTIPGGTVDTRGLCNAGLVLNMATEGQCVPTGVSITPCHVITGITMPASPRGKIIMGML